MMEEGFDMDDFNPPVDENVQDDEEETAFNTDDTTNDLEWDSFEENTYNQQSLTEQAANILNPVEQQSDSSTQNFAMKIKEI